jgi:hypothetical protein
MKKTIQQHIEDNRDELENPNISPQRRRHIQGELQDLESYHDHHPNDDHDPTPLELYCDSNPDALECRVYED